MTRYWFDWVKMQRDAEPAGGVAVDRDIGAEAVVLGVAGDVRELRQLAQPVEQLRRPGRELGGVGIFEHELVLGAADRGVDGQVLHRLQV